MAKTNADYQREHRQRRSARMVELAAARDALAAEVEGLRDALAAAESELERLRASQCKHPAGAVDGGRCHACGAEVW
jgi:hypothetical protein